MAIPQNKTMVNNEIASILNGANIDAHSCCVYFDKAYFQLYFCHKFGFEIGAKLREQQAPGMRIGEQP